MSLGLRYKQIAFVAIILTVSVANFGCGAAVSASSPTVTTPATPLTPAASLSKASLTFADQAINTSSAAQTVTLTNTGDASLSLGAITVSGEFAQTNTCPISLTAGSNCTISVTFQPTTLGSRSGALTVANNASGSPHQVTLTGNGTNTPAPNAILSPATLTFPDQIVNTTSAAQNVTLANTGTAPLTIDSITAGGDFAQSNNCGKTLAAGANCTVSVTFTPTKVGSTSGTLTVSDNAPGSPHSTNHGGKGKAAPAPTASLSASSVSFGNQVINTKSAPRTVTLTNTGTASLNISQIAANGDFDQSNNCGSSLAVGSTCTVSVTFTPAAIGSRTGSVVVTDDAAGSPHQVLASGTGTSAPTPTASLSAASLTFANQVLNTTSAPQTVTLSNTGTASLSISAISITGDFAQTNTCGSNVAAGASCTISVTFTPTALASRTGVVSVADNATGSPHQFAVNGTGTSAPTPTATLSTTSVTFPSQIINTTSTAQTVTLSNTGTASLSISAISMTGDFAQTNNCGTSVAAGANCTISITFKPTVTGSRNGLLSITDNASGSPHQVAVSGTGTNVPTPTATLSVASLTFANQIIDTMSVAKTVTLTNTGSATLNISGISPTGDFLQSNNCGANLAAGASCTLSVTFMPSALGTRTGAVTITDNATGSPHQITATGTGISAPTPTASLSASSLSFANQIINTTSAAQTVTLTNTGTAALSINAVTASGDFMQTNDCGNSLAAGANCRVSVTFKPTAIGARNGAVSITDNAAGSPHQITAGGTGISAPTPTATLSASSLTFTNQTINSISGTQTVTLSNTGNATLSISSITTNGDFAQTNNCGSTLTAGANCTISVTFKPTVLGSRTATLSVADNATGSPHQVSLSGTGVAAPQLTANPNSVAFGSIVVGQNSSKTVSLTNSGGSSLTISSASTDGPGFSLSGISLPLTLGAGQSNTFNVVFGPSNSGTASGHVYLSNDSPVSSYTIALSGTATAAPQHSVDLTWNASTSSVIGYNVYRGSLPGGPYTKINVSLQPNAPFTDWNVVAGQSYSYVVTAVNADNLESTYSPESLATIPTP